MTEGLAQARHIGINFFDIPADWTESEEVPASRVTAPPRVFDIGTPSNFPSHWQSGTFDVYGMPVRYYAANAPSKWGVNAACSGLKSPYAMDEQTIMRQLENGISVIWMELPNPGGTDLRVKCFQAAVEKFYLDPESPVHQLFGGETVKFASAHSTGGQRLTRLLSKPDLRAQMKDQYKVIFLDAPFYDTSLASVQRIKDATTKSEKLAAKFCEAAFRRYAYLHRDQLPQKTLCGRFFLNYGAEIHGREGKTVDLSSLKSISREASAALHIAVKTVRDLIENRDHLTPRDVARGSCGTDYLEPTYLQILKLQAKGRKVCSLTEAFSPDERPELIMSAGNKDPFSCPQTIRAMAEKLQADFYMADAAHNTIDQDEALLDMVMERFMAHKPVMIIDIPEENVALVIEDIRPFLPWISRDILRRGYESGTGALNSAAGFFQRFLGRGVGNAEVGGEAERRPVDAGHTLGLK
jgi:Ni,Fe-hydrogenase maturation factor